MYDGKPNLDGYVMEFLVDKVETIRLASRKVRHATEFLNDTLYYTYIPHHVRLGWNGLQAVRSICVKLALRYTDFNPTVAATFYAETNTLHCIRQIRLALRHINYCTVYNPRDNIKPSSLDLMSRLLRRCGRVIENFNVYIIETNEYVQAE